MLTKKSDIAGSNLYPQQMKATLLLLFFTFPLIANAYIDPGIGSTIFQAIIAGIIGGAYIVKIYWFKIIALFSRLKKLIKR